MSAAILTDRERLIVTRKRAGVKTGALAKELGITPPEVCRLQRSIRRKTGIDLRADHRKRLNERETTSAARARITKGKTP